MNRRPYSALIMLIASAFLFVAPACEKEVSKGTSATKSAYDEILASGVIRAGYLEYPPGCIRDPNTKKLSGVMVEALEQAAAAMKLKVEWVPASGWGTIVDDVRTQKYNLVGSPVWANSTRGKLVDFSTSLYWSGICAYVRADDHRFDADLSAINDEAVRIMCIDGEMSSIVATTDYPKGKRVALPESADNSLMLLSVAENKADVTFVEPFIAQLFLKNNPGKLRNITPSKPIRVFPNCMMLPKGDAALKSMMDIALNELKNSGVIDALVRKYSPEPGGFFLDAPPYRVDDLQR